MLEFALAVALMFLVVGSAARWAMRNGLGDRFGSKQIGPTDGGKR